VRFLVLALVAVLTVSASLFGPLPSVVRADWKDLLPTQDELNTALAPFTVAAYLAGPSTDGWDGTSNFDIMGSPDGDMHASVDVSELPSKEGAAGFLQTKLQQLRDGTKQGGFVGDVGPSSPELTMDADEAYFGVYVSPPDAPPQVVALQISRYADQVIATTVILKPNGQLTDNGTKTLGAVTGAILKLMNED
jgi:hypothetical protein